MNFDKTTHNLFLRPTKFTSIFRFVSIFLIIVVIVNFSSSGAPNALAATYTFVQTSWSGGITSNNAIHPDNQTGWNQYSASSTGMVAANSGASLELLQTSSSLVDTTDEDFTLGTLSSTTVMGVGSSAGLELVREGSVYYGDGSDGALTVSSSDQVINTYSTSGSNDYSSGATSITVDSTTGFSTGDEALIIQMSHATNAGKYEFKTNITVVNSTTISFSSGLGNNYYGTGSSGKTQVVRVPNYTNVTINSGASISADTWSYSTGKGGVIAFRATGDTTVSGSIDSNGDGYAGGAAGSGNNSKGTPGEGYNGLGVQANSPTSNSGGGGGGQSSGGDIYNAGGGGSYVASGGNGGTVSGGGGSYPGQGGTSYGVNTLSTFFAGSGGGGGSTHAAASAYGSNGGAGGGGIFVYSNSITVTGTVKANGSNGVAGSGQYQLSGGGGAGGSIYLDATTLSVGTSLVQSTYGSGGTVSCSISSACSVGGNGSNGRIRLNYISSLSGTANPSAYTFQNTVASSTSSYLSSVKDTGTASAYTTLSYTVNTPSNTSLTIDTRAGNTSTPDDTWTSWQTGILNGGNIYSLSGNRYFQYRANFSTSDTTVTPTLSDVTINYSYYSTSSNLTSSTYDSGDSANATSRIQWTENLPSSTDIKFQLRTAPDSSGSPGTWTSWLGPTGIGDYYTDPSGGETINSTHSSGSNDRWVQYKVFLTSNGSSTPTLSDITLSYVVNATPEVQAVTASQGSDGKVNISYEARDSDTSSGTANPGYITPSFQYYNGSTWVDISAGMATLSTTTKAVNQSTFTQYSTTWTATSTITSLYTIGAKIKVTVNDGEGANNTANAQSSTFTLDTKTPTSSSIVVIGTTTPTSLILSSSDDSSLQMKVGLSSDLSGSSWETYSSTKNISLSSDPSTVYVRFKDSYGNETSTISTATQTTPSGLMVQDTTNMNTSPPQYRLFTAWDIISNPSNGFGSYEVYRSNDEVVWTPIASISSRTTNYYGDNSAVASTTYYYKVATVDSLGNTSFLSSSISGTADAIQNSDEGGTGVDTTAPTISSVSATPITDSSTAISWSTNESSNSKLAYGKTSGSYTTTTSIDSTMTKIHSVALSGLDYETRYYYQVVSVDASGNSATSSENTFTTLEEQIGISLQQVFGGGGAVIQNGVPKSEFNKIKAEVEALRNQLLGINTSENNGNVSDEMISLVLNKFTEIVGGIVQSAAVSVKNEDRAKKLKKEIVPAVNSLKQLAQFITPPRLTTEPKIEIKSTEAVVKWSTDEPATSEVNFSEEKDYNETRSNDYTNTVEDVKNYSTDHIIILKGLTPLTDYHYRLVSESDVGAKAYSSDFTFTTKSELPTISDPKVKVAGKNFVVTWETNILTNSAVTYTTVINRNPEKDKAKTEGTPEFAKDHIITLSNLEPATIYQVEISSEDHFGNVVTREMGQMSIEKDIIPAEISQVRYEASILSGPSNKIQSIIFWKTDEPSTTQVVYQGGLINGNSADNFKENSSLNEEFTLNHIAVITSWQPGEVYSFKAVSIDAAGNKSESKVFTLIAPRQKATVFDLIVSNFSDTFGWTKKLGL